MEQLCEELSNFKQSSKTIIKQDSQSIKLYGLAFNLAWTLRDGIELCQTYEKEVKNSLLHERFEKNQELSEKIENSASEIVPYLENIVNTWSVHINDEQQIQVGTEDGEEAERLLADNKYLTELSKNLALNGNKILNIVCFYLRHLSKLLIDIKTVRTNLTDNDYRFLFEQEFNDYLSTQEWNDFKSSFIDKTIKKYMANGSEIDQNILNEILSAEMERIEELSECFGVIEPYLEDYSKLARIIVKMEFENVIGTPVLNLFKHLGTKGIITKWQEQLEEEELCYVPPVDDNKAEVTYGNQYSEIVCKRTFPKILELYKGRSAVDWVCFFHVLVFYSYISCDDFNAFNRWLTQQAGRELISTGNARKIKMSYWANEPMKIWTLPDALKETNSKQQEAKYNDYIRLCNDIHSIIKQG